MIATPCAVPARRGRTPARWWPGLLLSGVGDPDPLPAREAPAGSPRRAAGGLSLRVLIIEDNVDGATTLRDYLEMDGHQVCVAHTGPEGVEAAASFLPDVVLCDIGLPGMDGWEVARAIREAPATASARLIAITGYGTEEDRRRSEEAGFAAHLTKPLDIHALETLLIQED